MSQALADAAAYYARQAAARVDRIATLERAVAGLTDELRLAEARADEARRDADMWHDEAHRLGREVERLRALAVGATAPTPSSLT